MKVKCSAIEKNICIRSVITCCQKLSENMPVKVLHLKQQLQLRLLCGYTVITYSIQFCGGHTGKSIGIGRGPIHLHPFSA